MSRARPSPDPIRLQGDLDLFSVQAQWEALRARLTGQPGRLVLDLSGIGDLDLAGLQLLLAVARQAEADGTALALAGVKAEWIDRFRPLGFAPLLEGRP